MCAAGFLPGMHCNWQQSMYMLWIYCTVTMISTAVPRYILHVWSWQTAWASIWIMDFSQYEILWVIYMLSTFILTPTFLTFCCYSYYWRGISVQHSRLCWAKRKVYGKINLFIERAANIFAEVVIQHWTNTDLTTHSGFYVPLLVWPSARENVLWRAMLRDTEYALTIKRLCLFANSMQHFHASFSQSIWIILCVNRSLVQCFHSSALSI